MKKYLFIFFVLISINACTSKNYSLNPQSHYDFPNSNIKPIAYTSGSISEISISMFPPGFAGGFKQKAINNALKKQAGSDILINYLGEMKTTSLMYFHASTYTVTGMAAKMEIGKQILK